MFILSKISVIIKYLGLANFDLDMVLSARFLASPGVQPFQVTRNHDGYYRFSGSSSYERHFELGGMQQYE